MEYETLPVTNPFNSPVLYVTETDSTMSLARELAKEGYPDGTVIRAGFQSAGRGRIDGRRWDAEPGENLLCTVLLKRAPIRGFTLRVGLAVAQTFNRFLPDAEETRIKWPNDVLIQGKKVSGILCEGDGDALYIGTGFNLAQRNFPPEIAHKAASLATLFPGQALPSMNEFLEAYLSELHEALQTDDWHERVSERILYRGKRIRFLQGDPEREEWVEGIVEGIGPDGELLFRPDTTAPAPHMHPGVGATPACCAGTLRLFSGEIPYPPATP